MMGLHVILLLQGFQSITAQTGEDEGNKHKQYCHTVKHLRNSVTSLCKLRCPVPYTKGTPAENDAKHQIDKNLFHNTLTLRVFFHQKP